jgi:hypothetical protein
LQALYKEKYEEFEKDDIDKPFLKNVFQHYTKAFNTCIEPQNTEVLNIYKDSLKLHNNLNQLSYEQHKRTGVDYYDISTKYNHTLNSILKKMIELTVNIARNKDKLLVTKITRDAFNDLSAIYENYYAQLYSKIKNIVEKNQSIVKFTDKHLTNVEGFNYLLNSTHFDKLIPSNRYKQIHDLLLEKYKGNNFMINALLKVNHELNKKRVMVINTII